MTHITYYLDKNNVSVKILGHSGYEESGKDIVCASISSLSTLILNTLISCGCKVDYIKQEGVLSFSSNLKYKVLGIMLCEYFSALEQLAEQYNKYVLITREG